MRRQLERVETGVPGLGGEEEGGGEVAAIGGRRGRRFEGTQALLGFQVRGQLVQQQGDEAAWKTTKKLGKRSEF